MAPIRSYRGSIAAALVLLLAASGLAFAAPAGARGTASSSFNSAFASFPTQVTGSYTPLPGDFDCDGSAREIMWYGPGGAPDSFWTVTGLGPGVTKVSTPLAVNGTYIPFTGDWDNDDCDDIFWYAPGPAKDYVWYFDGPGPAFESVEVSVNGTYIPTAIAPAPGVGGVFWYAPGAGQEYIWLGGPGRGQFSSAPGPTVNGTDYRPIRLGDLDSGVPGDTMLFHRPGPGTDYVLDKVLFGNQAPISTPVDIGGTHIPLGVFGDNPVAIMYGPGADPDLLFGPLGAPPPPFGTVAPGTVNGLYTPAVSLSGDFIVWHAPGGATDYLWIGVT